MQVETGRRLSELTTLRVGGPARELIEASTSDEIVEAVREADRTGVPLLVLGGGSNVLVGDDGFDGRVLRIMSRGVKVDRSDGDAIVEVQAGEPWDEVVAAATSQHLAGFECMSGIPGGAGATPVQNVGAYGEEIATSFVSLCAFDRLLGSTVTMIRQECGFGYRTSAFKRNNRWVILSVTFRLRQSDVSVPIRYAELARKLDVDVHDRASLDEVRTAVLGLRRSKGMVLDADDPDTRSAGSFFTNPILTREEFARLATSGDAPPEWPIEDGRVKTSAAWLIEKAGFQRGYVLGPVRLSTKHTLAITNASGGSATEVVALAKRVRDGVLDRFGIALQPEPVLVGVDL